MNEQSQDILIEAAMAIILNAGNARQTATKALEYAKEFEFEKANELMKQADSEINLAHKAQTNIIQDEARGIKYEHSLLFAHAQDTLMTIVSEIRFSKELLSVLKTIEKRLLNVEK